MRRGTLRVIDSDGRLHIFAGAEPWQTVTIRFHDRAVARELMLNGPLTLGETFMAGRLTVEDASIYDFLELVGSNIVQAPLHPVMRAGDIIGRWLRVFQQYNPLWKSRLLERRPPLRSVRHALPAVPRYSTGNIPAPISQHRRPSLETRKPPRSGILPRSCCLQPGQRVLDIGCGWGGLALYLARDSGVEVTGLTLSGSSSASARARAAEAGLADRVDSSLQRLSRDRPAASTASSRSACSNMSASCHYRRLLPEGRRRC